MDIYQAAKRGGECHRRKYPPLSLSKVKFVKDSSIRATLFKGKVQKCVGKSLEIVICVNFS